MVTVAQQHQHQNQEDGSCYQNENDARNVTVEEPRPKEDDDSLEEEGPTISAVVPASSKVFVNPEEDGSQDESSDMDESVEGEGEDQNWNTVAPMNVVRHTSNDPELPPGIDDVPSFGDVCVKNSTNVHLGNKTSYNGPVTIKQFVYTNPNLLGDSGTSCIPPIGAKDLDEETGNGLEKKFTGAGRPPVDPIEEYKDLRGCSWILTWRCIALLCTLASFLVATVVISVVLLSGDRVQVSKFPVLPDPSIDREAFTEYDGLRFVTRDEWLAQPAAQKMDELNSPVPYVIISHTASDFCDTQSECTYRVRFIQTFHIESRGWSDIAYNFLVGGDGLCYVGRSWRFVGAHSFGYNNRSIGISFIGTFNSVVPSKSQLNAAKKVIELGVKKNYIAPNYKLLGHRQVSATLSPGDALYDVIKTWPHWSPTP